MLPGFLFCLSEGIFLIQIGHHRLFIFCIDMIVSIQTHSQEEASKLTSYSAVAIKKKKKKHHPLLEKTAKHKPCP